MLEAAESAEKEVSVHPPDRDIVRDVTGSQTGEGIPQTGFSLREKRRLGRPAVSHLENNPGCLVCGRALPRRET